LAKNVSTTDAADDEVFALFAALVRVDVEDWEDQLLLCSLQPLFLAQCATRTTNLRLRGFAAKAGQPPRAMCSLACSAEARSNDERRLVRKKGLEPSWPCGH
jgi:hypothetical protein